MPYIKKERRKELFCLSTDDSAFMFWNVETPGELNYAFTHILNSYLENKKLSYQTINEIIGALEGSKLEFYRRIVAPYEDKKIEENGDVY
jgi:hypothetical protein